MADQKETMACTRRKLHSTGRLSLLALLATSASGVLPAYGVDAIWLGNNAGNPTAWVEPLNWSGGVLPDGTATFTSTGQTTVDANGIVSIGMIQFTAVPEAQAYTITNNDTFIVNGSGVINNSTNPQTFNVNASMLFQNSAAASGGAMVVTYINASAISFNDTSTAGTAIISNNGVLEFNNSATAGSATVTNNAVMNFYDTTSAGGAAITNAATGTLTFNGTTTANTATIVNNGTAQFTNSSTAGSANITVNNLSSLSFGDTSTAGMSTINNAGEVNFNNSSKAGSSNITLTGSSLSFNDTSTAELATISNGVGGLILFNNTATAGNAGITNNNGGSTVFGNSNGTDTATAGSAQITNNLGGQTQFLAATTAGNSTITNNVGGTLQFGTSGGAGTDTATAGNATITNNGAAVFNAATTGGNAVITTNNGAGVFFFDTSGGGNAQFITNAGGNFNMSSLTAAGMTAGSIAGAGSYILGARSLTVGSNNLSTTVDGVISGIGGSLTKVGTGTLILTNTNTYSGTTTINGGTLVVDGSNASSTTTVNAGGTLAGSGTVGDTAVTGGTFAPGSAGGSVFGPFTVQGNLSFTAASTYMIQVSPANAGLTNVTGSATLGGATVSAVFSPGNYVQTQYTILTAANLTGTFNPTVASNIGNLQSTLSYDATNVYLNVTLGYTPPPGGFNVNQQNVANTLTNYFTSTGSIPAAFAALNAAGLTVASGELGTGAIQSSIRADNLFLNLLLDPTVAGRTGGFVPPGAAPSFAAEDGATAYAAKRLATPTERAAYAMATKAPLLGAQLANRWSIWGAAYGGSATTDGNAVIGSQDVSARVWGVMAGADYKFAPNTLIGFALAGGGTNYSLANALGSGSSNLFQAGVFGRHNFGAAYVASALAYGWHDVTTDRTVTLAGFDQLQGRFRAETFSARFEGGYRFATPAVGITPYAAAQVISFNLPAYAEQAIAGTPQFALNYADQTTTATRTELGLRTDKSFAMQGAMLTLRGRAAWAHDYNPDRSVTALFQALPGTTFVVNGARSDADAALVSAGAEVKWLNGFSLAGTFEGEFSGNTTSYAGKGVAKYSW